VFYEGFFSVTSVTKDLIQNTTQNVRNLWFYTYNGEKVYWSRTSDAGIIQKIMAEIETANITETKNWSFEDITLPIYGLLIHNSDNEYIFGAWSNNHWISQDGTVYTFNFNFEKFVSEYATINAIETMSFTDFPCARFLTQNENQWNTALLTPAKELNPPKNITATLNSWDSPTVNVTVTNKSDTPYPKSLNEWKPQVLLDGVWYQVPLISKYWVNYWLQYWAQCADGVNYEGTLFGLGLLGHYILDIPCGESYEEIGHIGCFGELPIGTYRLESQGLTVELTKL
jgi:hypothetical protein